MEGINTGPNYRTKAYKRIQNQNWEDVGTGYLNVLRNENEFRLNIIYEGDDTTVLLDSVIEKETVYIQESGTLIVWKQQTDDSLDYAISFQSSHECQQVWQYISEIQHGSYNNDRPRESFVDMLNDIPRLPEPEPGNLVEIRQALMRSRQYIYRREQLAGYLVSEDYIKKLVQMYEIFTDLEDTDSLEMLCDILQNIVILNDASIIEYMIRDDIIFDLVGILEYDPRFQPNSRPNYRDTLKSIKFKQITPIESAAVEAKINQTSHLIFLRDIVLTNILDDELQGMLGSLIFLRHIEIIKHFQQDQHYMKRLFRILGLESADSVEQKRDVVTFMHQFCSIVKMIPPTYCSGVYRSLSQYGLFNLFRFALQDDDKRIKQAGVEILGSVLAQDRALVRSFALDQVKHQQSQHGEGSIGNQTLLGLLVDSIRKAGGMNDGEEEGGIHSQCGDIIRVLLDTTVSAGAGDSNSNNYGGNGSDEFEGSQKNGENKDKSPQAKKGMDVETAEFLECFYSKYMAEMMRPLFVIDEATIPKIDASRLRAWVVQFLCEILTLSVTHHSCRSRYFVFSSDVVDHIVKLFSCKRKELKLAALRFIRACVGLRNVFYTKYLIRKSILNRVVELFDEVVGRNNLINSACLELFQFILRENLKPLVAHLVKHYAKRYQGLTYTSVFKDLAFLHDQNENEANALQSNAASAFGAGRDGEEEAKAVGGGGVWSNRKVDADEEAYFDAADDEDGLVGDDYAQPSPPIVSPQSENGRVTSGSNSSEDNEDVENKSDKEGSQGRDTATRNPPPLSSPYSSSRSGSESRGSWEPRSGTSRDGGGGLSIRKRESDREDEDDIIQSLVNRSPKKPARHLAFSGGGNYRIGSSGKRQQQQQQQQQPHPTTPFRVTTAMTASVDSAAKVRAKARPLSLSGGKFIPIKFNRQGLSRSPSPSSCSDDTGSTSSHVGHRDSSSRITPNNRHNDGGNADNHAVNPPATATLHPQQ